MSVRRLLKILAFCALFLLLAAPVLAQDAEYRLTFRRDFGYGNGGDVRGNMSVLLAGDEANVQSVTFLMDGQKVAEQTAPPYKFSFNTADYSLGQHVISAVVTTKDGRSVTTNEIARNFVSADVESGTMRKILVPIVGMVVLITLGGAALQYFSMRGNATRAPGTPRNYGMIGGAICSRCGRPFPIHIWGINLGLGKLDRCDNCGKWSIVRRASPDMLAAAEQAELAAARTAESGPLGNGAPETEEERLRKLLDQSRYTDNK
jgi:hypothetical protein